MRLRDPLFVFALRFLFLFGLWLLLSGRYDALHVILGLISAFVVALEVRSELPSDLLEQEQVRIITFLRRTCRLVVYSFWLGLEILKANLYVLTLAFTPKVTKAIDPQILRFPTSLKSDFAKYLFATSITLTPGTVTVRIEGDEMVVHAITGKAASSLTSIMQEKIRWVFE